MLLAGIADALSCVHRVIAGTPVGMETDHRDRDGLNNRRSNLRNATIAQNRSNAAISADNTSGVKGVCRDKWTGREGANLRDSRYERRFDAIEDAIGDPQCRAPAQRVCEGFVMATCRDIVGVRLPQDRGGRE